MADTNKELSAAFMAVLGAYRSIQAALGPLEDYLVATSRHNSEAEQRRKLHLAAGLVEEVRIWLESQPGDLDATGG